MSVMPAISDDVRTELFELCRRFDVEKLEVFGSFVTGVNFSDDSDVDFLVEFLVNSSMRAGDQYFGFKDALEELFRRNVDLVMTRAIENPYFLRDIAKSRATVYESKS